jgi:hypothetical protein
MKTIRTDRARTAFISRFSETCNVSEACRAANISRCAAYAWRKDDPEFAAEWDDAEQTAIDKLEQVAWERATDDKSDRMLEILLKAHRPEKYVDRVRSELTGPGGSALEISVNFKTGQIGTETGQGSAKGITFVQDSQKPSDAL